MRLDSMLTLGSIAGAGTLLYLAVRFALKTCAAVESFAAPKRATSGLQPAAQPILAQVAPTDYCR